MVDVENNPQPQAIAPNIRILLLEDDALLAKYFGKFLLSMGVSTVETAHTNASALAIIEAVEISAAFLDVSLGAETCEMTARILWERGTPFTFLSGRSLDAAMQARYPGVQCLTKPAMKGDLKGALISMGCGIA